MTARRLSAADAQTYWMSAKIPNDQFLLYVFAGVPEALPEVLAGLRARAAACGDLRLRIADDCPLRYPAWVSGEVVPEQFVLHDGPWHWNDCRDQIARLADAQLDPRTAAWRLHVFARVHGLPATDGPGTVAVLQVAHALADGTRTADLAGWLFGRPGPVAPVDPPRPGSLLPRGVAAARTHRQLQRDITAGRVPPPPPARPVLSTNARPTGARRVRTLLRGRRGLTAGPTVTVSALVAISEALAGWLRDHGEDPAALGVEVPMAKAGPRRAHNHFRNVGVGLYPELARRPRAERIVADLAAARRRGEHPATLAAARSFAAVPAPLLRWGVAQFDETVRPAQVTGNSVVSSVNRGPADLQFGSAPVVFTGGYPALSPMMGLTHGLHGIGDTVALSVHAADSAIDIDEYVARLEDALG